MTRAFSYEYEEVRYFKFGYSPLGEPWLYTYVYFIDGLLIDTGQRAASKKILSTLSDLPVDQLLITHHHEDHSGNIQLIRDHFGVPAYASKECCELMKAPPPISLAQRMVWGSRPADYDLVPLTSDRLETPSFSFEIIPIPGHAADMIALYEPERKWLFSADLFINTYIGYFLANESIIQQINSIKRMLQLDFEVLFCSHNPQLQEGRQKLEQKLHYLESFNSSVVTLHQKGLSAQEIFKELKLKEIRFTYYLSHGMLSRMNMVRSVIRDYEKDKPPKSETAP